MARLSVGHAGGGHAMLFVPARAGSAHIMQFGPIGLDQHGLRALFERCAQTLPQCACRGSDERQFRADRWACCRALERHDRCPVLSISCGSDNFGLDPFLRHCCNRSATGCGKSRGWPKGNRRRSTNREVAGARRCDPHVGVMGKNPARRLHLAVLAATLALLLLAGSTGLIFAQVPGGGIGPAPAPTPGQSISIGPGNLGGGIGPAPAPTPGQSISIAPRNLGGGIGPAPAPTPGQSISIAPNTRRGRGVTPRAAPDQGIIASSPNYLRRDNGVAPSSSGLRATICADPAQPCGEPARRHHRKKTARPAESRMETPQR
jgi:hypothetical protein